MTCSHFLPLSYQKEAKQQSCFSSSMDVFTTSIVDEPRGDIKGKLRAQINGICPLGIVNTCTKFNSNLSDSCFNLRLFQKPHG